MARSWPPAACAGRNSSVGFTPDSGSWRFVETFPRASRRLRPAPSSMPRSWPAPDCSVFGFDLSGSTLEVPEGHAVGLAILDPTVFLPAAGQGAIVIETRSGEPELAGTVFRIDHLPTWNRIRAERAWLGVLGAGCQTPVGVFSGKLRRRPALARNHDCL